MTGIAPNWLLSKVLAGFQGTKIKVRVCSSSYYEGTLLRSDQHCLQLKPDTGEAVIIMIRHIIALERAA